MFRTPLKQLDVQSELRSDSDAGPLHRADGCRRRRQPERLERQVAYLDMHPEVAILGTAFEMLNGEKDMPEIVVLPTTDAAIRKRLPFRFVICHPTVMFRRQTVIAHAGYRDSVFCEDVDLWIRLSRDRTLQFANLPEPLLKCTGFTRSDQRPTRRVYRRLQHLLRESLVQRSLPLFAGLALDRQVAGTLQARLLA